MKGDSEEMPRIRHMVKLEKEEMRLKDMFYSAGI